jgi:hypothetical protein
MIWSDELADLIVTAIEEKMSVTVHVTTGDTYENVGKISTHKDWLTCRYRVKEAFAVAFIPMSLVSGITITSIKETMGFGKTIGL